MIGLDMDAAWIARLNVILDYGSLVKPRGQLTKETLGSTVCINMRLPVLTLPARNLNHRFMAAEAYWILVGDRSVEGIAPWNSRIAQFSDDGATFAGAYGPKIRDQLGWVVMQLLKDKYTRQAVLTIWERNPAPSKDIPCTVAMQFLIREDILHLVVTMRSSDAWLGLPYDCFNFSMLAMMVCSQLRLAGYKNLEPGTLILTAGSSHLYERDWAAAEDCVKIKTFGLQPEVPTHLWNGESDGVLTYLRRLRDTKKGDPLRWWETQET